MKKGHDVIVLEASGRHGGHVYTAHDELSDGLYGDYGQEHITKQGYDIYIGDILKSLTLRLCHIPGEKMLLGG
jgi:monoamine oxidase